MGRYVDGVIAALKRTFDVKVWGYFFLIMLVEFLIGLIASVIIVLPFILYFLGLGIFESPLAIVQIFTNPATLMNLLVFGGITLVVLVIAWVIVGTFFDAVRYAFSKNILEKNQFDLGATFQGAKSSFISLFGVRVLWGLIYLAIFFVLMLPVIFSVLSVIQQIQSNPLMFLVPNASNQILAASFGALIMFVLMIVIYTIIAFFLAPFATMAVPAAVFEKPGIVASFRRGISLVKGKYLQNLGFLVLLEIFVIVISVAVSLVGIVLSLPEMAFSVAPSAVAVWVVVFVAIIRFVINIIVAVWANSFGSIGITKLYLLNAVPASRKPKPVAAPKP